MCILCVVQKWSRKVATMLPWLVTPLIVLWLLSELLPPEFRFEITSSRLACVLVLLSTLFWYEVLMPHLSSWQVRRNARRRERKRVEAIELQKLRKTATRRCRNCKTPYRDQNPSGGRFMCSYCGHISKRPVLELSVPPGLGQLSYSESLKDLVGKGGKMLNGKVWSGNNWPENGGNWVNGSLSGKSSYSKKNRGSFSNSSNDHFFSGKSNSFLLVFIYKSLATIFLGITWLWRKLFRVSLGKGNTSADADLIGLAKNGVNCNESRTEKARRKAEEKRQTGLEREQLEEEERKQREEVARLVEERRKLRDVNAETVKDHCKASPRDSSKRETERKRQERKKKKDCGSSKSSSDVDELEKRAGKEIVRNRKGDTDHHEHQVFMTESSKLITTNNRNKGSDGSRYLDHMRGKGGFFRKRTNANVQITVTKRDFGQPDRAHRKLNQYADDEKQSRPVLFESQPNPAPKRSWKQLFTGPSSTTSSTTSNVISRPNGKSQTEAQSLIASGFPDMEGFDNPITSRLPSKFSHEKSISMKSPQLSSNSILEELDHFENPSYDPDPTSLIGPVSESLDNFQLDLGLEPNVGFEVNRPSPIESPMSQLWGSEEMHANSFLFPSTQGTYVKSNLPMEDGGTKDEKEWQMWNQDILGLVGGLPIWKEKAARVSDEGAGTTSMIVPPAGGLYSTPDVHSFWSYE